MEMGLADFVRGSLDKAGLGEALSDPLAPLLSQVRITGEAEAGIGLPAVGDAADGRHLD